MKKKFLFCQLLLAYVFLPFQAIASNAPFSNIFVFGDSLSDNGNINSLSLPELEFSQQSTVQSWLYERPICRGGACQQSES